VVKQDPSIDALACLLASEVEGSIVEASTPVAPPQGRTTTGDPDAGRASWFPGQYDSKEMFLLSRPDAREGSDKCYRVASRPSRPAV